MTSAVAALGAGALGTAIGLKVLDHKLGVSNDLHLAKAMLPLFIKYKLKIDKDYTVTDMWYETLKKHAARTFLIFENTRMTYADVEIMSNEMAHYLLSKGVKPGNAVSLDFPNKPALVVWWMAVTKIGARVSLLNYQVKQKSLKHCIKESNSVFLICDEYTEQIVADVADTLPCKVIFFGVPTLFTPYDAITVTGLFGYPHTAVPACARELSLVTRSHIFTPVALLGCRRLCTWTSATVSFFRYLLLLIFLWRGRLRQRRNTACVDGQAAMSLVVGICFFMDVMYTCLPLYHTSGGGIGISSVMLNGASVVIAKRFSNAQFWPEISRHGCTVIQYIGELCRYLVNYAEGHPEVKDIPHQVRWAIGNGLRPEIWDAFQDGFNIQNICEFYGATESNGLLINVCRKDDLRARGSVGRFGYFSQKYQKYKIAKFNLETEELIRNADGLCIECKPGEVGELLFPILDNRPLTKFLGYTDEKATKKKVATDVIAKGDKFFRTGDLLSADIDGYFFFADRIGDTFRWKGENVSTTEVAEALTTYGGIDDANVYGVKVPGMKDGRGCMVALTLAPATTITDEWLDGFAAHVQDALPLYAQPLFIRVLEQAHMTSTFKQQKSILRDEGCDPSKITDALYWRRPEDKKCGPPGP